MQTHRRKKECHYIVLTSENKPVAVYRNLRNLHRDLRRYNEECQFPFLRFKDMLIYTGEDDNNASFKVICVRNTVYWHTQSELHGS